MHTPLITARAAGSLILATAVLCSILAPSLPVILFTILSGATFACAVFLDRRYAMPPEVAPTVRGSSDEYDLFPKAAPTRPARRNDLAPHRVQRTGPTLGKRETSR